MDDPQNSPASSGSKTFGIHKYNPEYCLGSGAQREDRRRGYEDKYEDDALYEELGDNARIWRVMLDEGRANDGAMLQRFRDHLDVDLVFAGLFSAVLTTFVAQTSQTPSDTGDTTIALLLEIIAIQRAWANNPRVNDVASFSLPPPSPSPSPWINRCWFLSLIFSLLAAFGAVVVRQWLQEYESDITGPPKRRALVRHYRRVGLEKYKVHLIVPILPMLLHVSLLLFFIGLSLYVRQSDRTMSDGIIALTAMIYVVYLGTNILPVFRPQCPYRSPLSTGAHWMKSFVALLYALPPGQTAAKALKPLALRCYTAVTHLAKAAVVWLSTTLPNSIKSADADTVEQASRVYTTAKDQLKILSRLLEIAWADIFKSPADYEWKDALGSLDYLIPNSLDSMIQASSDLSITPLVVQATSGLPIDYAHYGDTDFDDPRYRELLRHRILPWFVNVLSTRKMVFDWVPGREAELHRMACTLLLVPVQRRDIFGPRILLWGDIATTQYCTCVSRVLQALTSALLNLPNTPRVTATDVATLSAILLALGNRLDDLDRSSALLRDGALLKTIAQVYSSFPNTQPLAALRLSPVIWHEAVTYLHFGGQPADNQAHFAVTIWRSMYSEASFPADDNQLKERLTASSRVTLQEWLLLHPGDSKDAEITICRLLCPRSCDSHMLTFLQFDKQSPARRLHATCHAIDSYVKGDNADGNAAFDDNLGFLVKQFVGALVTTFGYGSIDSALRSIEHSAVAAMFKSTFIVRPCLSFALFVKADERLPATFAVSLFWFLVKLASESYRSSSAILRALGRHVTEYHEVLAEAPDYDDISLEILCPVIDAILRDPWLAVLDISDALTAAVATQLSKLTNQSNLLAQSPRGSDDQPSAQAPSDPLADHIFWCLGLDVLCAARTNTKLSKNKLHSVLLYAAHSETWRSELVMRLTGYWVPIAAALAFRSSSGQEVLAELVDDISYSVQDLSCISTVRVPKKALEGEDLNWYRLFTSDPDKHIYAPDRHENWVLPISELVSFEEAVERMQKYDAERAARETQRGSQGDGAETDANDDAEIPGREHGLDGQGGAERTQNKIIDRLKAAGAWGARPFKGVRPFLARIPRLRQVGGRERPSSFALSARDVDIERDAGTSPAPEPEQRGGSPPAPARASEGGQQGDTSLAVSERSGGDARILALASEGGRDGVRAQDGAQAQEDAQARDDEQSHDDKRARDGEQDQDSWQDQEDAHAQDDERSQAGEEPHVQRGQTPDEAVGTGARDDAEHGGTSARGTSDAGQGGVQGHGGEHDQTGEPARGDQNGWSDAQDRDGEQAKAGAQDRNSAQSQAHEVPLAQTQETEVELRARDDTADEGEH